MKKKGPDRRVSAPMELRDVVDRAVREDGVLVQDLSVGDVLTVTTRNHVYMFLVTDPRQRAVIASGGVFPTATEVHLVGSSLSGTGTMVRLGWIAVGYRLALGATILLSSTTSVDLNGVRVLPRPTNDVH